MASVFHQHRRLPAVLVTSEGAEVDIQVQARLREGVAFIPVGDRAVLYVEEDGLLHRLDPVATEILRHLDGLASIHEATSALIDIYDADPKEVATDVGRFVRALTQERLIETHGDGGGAMA